MERIEKVVSQFVAAMGLTKILVPLSAVVAILATVYRMYMEMRGHR